LRSAASPMVPENPLKALIFLIFYPAYLATRQAIPTLFAPVSQAKTANFLLFF
jgi:hypothetical protein